MCVPNSGCLHFPKHLAARLFSTRCGWKILSPAAGGLVGGAFFVVERVSSNSASGKGKVLVCGVKTQNLIDLSRACVSE